jgi:hypothetical protein
MTYVLEILLNCGSGGSFQTEDRPAIPGDNEKNRQIIDVSWHIVRDIRCEKHGSLFLENKKGHGLIGLLNPCPSKSISGFQAECKIY